MCIYLPGGAGVASASSVSGRKSQRRGRWGRDGQQGWAQRVRSGGGWQESQLASCASGGRCNNYVN